jgi:hypothetical protein
MSQIPFVNALGDAIDRAIANEAPEPRRRWIRVPRGRGRLTVVLATLAVGGAAYAATQQSETKLVTAGLACIGGRNLNAPDGSYDVEPHGRSPQAACAQVMGVPASKLVACRDPHGYVIVFEADGRSRQCRRLGLPPLQVAPFLVAAKRVDELARHLWRFKTTQRCIPFRTLQHRVQDVLTRLGWTGWHAVIERRSHGDPAGGGRCGMFEATGRYVSDPTASIDGQNDVVSILRSPPLRVLLQREKRAEERAGR